MSWRSAFSNLAAIGVTGVNTSYDLDALPSTLPAANLPALVPDFPAGAGLPREDGRGLSTLTYDGAVWRAGLEIDHVLYWTPAALDAGLTAVLPALIDAVDAYLAAVSADGTLGGVLHEPLEVLRVQVGTLERGGVRYYGACFRHRWVRLVGG